MKPCDVSDTHDEEGVEIYYPEMELTFQGGETVETLNYRGSDTASDVDALVNSYWKMSHILQTYNPYVFEKYLPAIEDHKISFAEFVKKVNAQ